MSWRPAGRESHRRLVDWLEVDEWKHAALSARLKSHGCPSVLGRIADGRLWFRSVGDLVDGALFVSRFGVVLPAYADGGRDEREDAFLTKLFSSRRDKLFSIIGMEDRVRDVEARTSGSVRDAESYRMFTLEKPLNDGEAAGAPNPAALEVRKAGRRDFDLLWPLERGYQIEEVIRKGGRLNERFAKKRFLETLEEHTVYCAVKNGEAVAKAQTNARGWTCEQIGGVYATPGSRKKGYARAVMEALVSDIHSRGAASCLFVKDSNLPALRLYRNLGFVDRGRFRISYY